MVEVTASHLSRPLDALLATLGNVRVLRVLIRHGGQLPLSRVARDAKLSLPGLRKIIDNLEHAGVVKMIGSGHARLYQAEMAHPLIKMLENLFRAEADYRTKVLAAITAAAADMPFKAVWLFGSAARHEDRLESDLDLMVITELDPVAHEVAADAFRMNLDGEPMLTGLRPSVIAITLNDLREMIAKNNPLWKCLRNDAKVLAGRTPQQMIRITGQKAA
jgi:DNA-binding Lrp family transcriptional regulator